MDQPKPEHCDNLWHLFDVDSNQIVPTLLANPSERDLYKSDSTCNEAYNVTGPYGDSSLSTSTSKPVILAGNASGPVDRATSASSDTMDILTTPEGNTEFDTGLWYQHQNTEAIITTHAESLRDKAYIAIEPNGGNISSASTSKSVILAPGASGPVDGASSACSHTMNTLSTFGENTELVTCFWCLHQYAKAIIRTHVHEIHMNEENGYLCPVSGCNRLCRCVVGWKRHIHFMHYRHAAGDVRGDATKIRECVNQLPSVLIGPRKCPFQPCFYSAIGFADYGCSFGNHIKHCLWKQ
jgi:hypothetical protein